jgi:hypothetical protein
MRDRSAGESESSAPVPFLSLPRGKTQGKHFFAPTPNPNVVSDQKLACDSPVESKARQGSGRETPKTARSPFGIDGSMLSYELST